MEQRSAGPAPDEEIRDGCLFLGCIPAAPRTEPRNS